jgi:predicted nucleotidyltransferase
MDRNEILESIQSNLGKIKSYGIERIGLFGSYARCRPLPESDVDILVSFREGEKTFDNYMDLKFFLENLFDGISVDLVVEETLKEAIKPYVYEDMQYVT